MSRQIRRQIPQKQKKKRVDRNACLLVFILIFSGILTFLLLTARDNSKLNSTLDETFDFVKNRIESYEIYNTNDQVKSLEELVHIYIGAVGGNATFLLNIPPMPNGLLHKNDVKRLEEFGSWKRKSFVHNLMGTAHVFSENEDPAHPASNLTKDTLEAWYQPESSELPVEITICLDDSYNLGYLVLKEAVCYSQRVEKYEVFVKEGEIWNSIYTGTVIGYQKIIPVKGKKAREMKIVLHDFRVLPLLTFIGIYPENT